MIHMKCQVLFSLEDNKKKKLTSSATVLLRDLRVNMPQY